MGISGSIAFLIDCQNEMKRDITPAVAFGTASLFVHSTVLENTKLKS